MFIRSADQPSLLSKSMPSIKKEYAPPDPADRGACARFRMRWRAFKSRRPLPATVEQLQQAKLDFYQRLNDLNKTVIEQARAFNEHLLSCTRMLNTFACLVRAGPASIPLVQQPATNKDCAASPHDSTSSNPVPSIPVSRGHPLHSQVTVQADSSSSSHTQALSHSHKHNISSSTKSISTTLPRLRGFFNKPKQKHEQDRCG